MYKEKLKEPMKKCERRANYAGTAFGFANFILYAMYAA